MTTPNPDNTLDPDAAAWLGDNREAISSANAWVEAQGLPLRDLRLF
ncbi:type II toxin-antitoxin system CcdA family antitoxin [Porphyrobacter sp. HT-58-2]|nr:type II toxin-antitoxin system CcdA family antitoxin [Porphyrobacter sp. HT-58-2]